jgi:NAD-dependent dihydropyrimidine dehydrogenase PreA subunit
MEEKRAPKARPAGSVEVRVDECKGCGYCIEQCPPKVLILSPAINRMGYHPAKYIGEGCTGCGICFYACPEPGALTVYKTRPSAEKAVV